MKKYKTLYFDFDGTIHNSLKIYAPAFRKAYNYLSQNGYAVERTFIDTEIQKWLGYNKKEMWEAFMPQLPEEIRDNAGYIIGQTMNELVKDAKLYDNATNILSELVNRGYLLIFISNCSNRYLKDMRQKFQLDKYFKEYYTAEAFGNLPKHQILSIIKDKYYKEAVMIGDRYKDIEAGLKNDIDTIGCLYGYGSEEELSKATFRIGCIDELLDIL